MTPHLVSCYLKNYFRDANKTVHHIWNVGGRSQEFCLSALLTTQVHAWLSCNGYSKTHFIVKHAKDFEHFFHLINEMYHLFI